MKYLNILYSYYVSTYLFIDDNLLECSRNKNKNLWLIYKVDLIVSK